MDFSYLRINYKIQIVSEVGRGGYGVVYKGVHPPFEKGEQAGGVQVAVKINFNTCSKEMVLSEAAFLMLASGLQGMSRFYNLFTFDDVTHLVTYYFDNQPFIVTSP